MGLQTRTQPVLAVLDTMVDSSFEGEFYDIYNKFNFKKLHSLILVLKVPLYLCIRRPKSKFFVFNVLQCLQPVWAFLLHEWSCLVPCLWLDASLELWNQSAQKTISQLGPISKRHSKYDDLLLAKASAGTGCIPQHTISLICRLATLWKQNKCILPFLVISVFSYQGKCAYVWSHASSERETLNLVLVCNPIVTRHVTSSLPWLPYPN